MTDPKPMHPSFVALTFSNFINRTYEPTHGQRA